MYVLCVYVMCMCCVHTHIETGLITVFYAEIVHIFPESVLSRQAGIPKISFFVFPFLQPSVIEHFYIILNNKRRDIIPQTLFEKNKPSDSAVSVLKRMYSFKIVMELQKLVKAFFL